MMTRSSSAAGRGGGPDEGPPASSESPPNVGFSPGLALPADMHMHAHAQQPFYMSAHPSSAGILDLFQAIGPSGSLPLPQPSAPHHPSLLHPDDMLW